MEFDSSDEEEPSPKRHCSTPVRANAVSRRAMLEQSGVNGEAGEEAIAPVVTTEGVEQLKQRDMPPNQDQDCDDQPGPDYFGLSAEDMGKISLNRLICKVASPLFLLDCMEHAKLVANFDCAPPFLVTRIIR